MKERVELSKTTEAISLRQRIESLAILSHKNVTRGYLDALREFHQTLTNITNEPFEVGERQIDFAKILDVKPSSLSSRVRQLNHFVSQKYGVLNISSLERFELLVLSNLVQFKPTKKEVEIAVKFWKETPDILQIIKSSITVKDYAKKHKTTEARIRRFLSAKTKKPIENNGIWTKRDGGVDYILTQEALEVLNQEDWTISENRKMSPQAKRNLELFLIYDIGRKATRTLEKNNVKGLKKEKLLSDIKRGEAALELLILENNGLVYSIAMKYEKHGVPLDDLVQEGRKGLIHSNEMFDPERGYDWVTSATGWIRQAIVRSLPSQGRNIRLPAHMGERSRSFKRQTALYLAEKGREAEPDELQKRGFTVGSQNRLSQIPTEVSLDRPIDDNRTLADVIPGTSDFLDAEINAQFQIIAPFLEDLPPSLLRTLKFRFGLFDGKPYKLEEIAKKEGVTRERIRQREERGLQILRRKLDEAGIEIELD